MTTKEARRAEAMRKHVELCQERTRRLHNEEIERQEAEQEATEKAAQARRAQFKSVRASS